MSIDRELKRLKSLGCFPSIYRRGNMWRAHINMAGNFWADEKTPAKALRTAVEMWERAGRIMDGRAR